MFASYPMDRLWLRRWRWLMLWKRTAIPFLWYRSYDQTIGPPRDRNTLSKHKVIIIEEHVPEGKLIFWVKQIAWDIQAKSSLHTFTLKDGLSTIMVVLTICWRRSISVPLILTR